MPMRKRDFLYPALAAVLAALPLASCREEGPAPSGGTAYPLVVRAQVNGADATRAQRITIDDLWSYCDFTDNDVMGLYASGGNMMDGNGNGPFNNQRLVYEGKQFNDPANGALFSPTHMDGSEIFMYFPYSADMEGSGMELRSAAEGGQRCIDLLSSDRLNIQGFNGNQEMALYGTFDHAFSELIIMRGEGFDAPPANKDGIDYQRITAVLSQPYTHLKLQVVLESSWSCTPTLQCDQTTEREEARKWHAWKGGNYGITEEDPVGVDAWYIIVPTLPGNYSTVEYIELYDNEGYLQRVSSLRFSNGKKQVMPGLRYPMEITMKELVPTVNPFKIIPWNKDVDLTDERTRGINNLTEFSQWVSDYNAYLLDPSDNDKTDALLKYGDQYIDASGNSSWHFYVLSDLDFKNYVPLPWTNENDEEVSPGNTVIIPKLIDILDGVSTTLAGSKFINHKITNLTLPFVGELAVNPSDQNNGSVQNFDFIEPEISDAADSEATGIIVRRMEGSSVVNCRIDNGTLFHPAGPAGMVCGSVKNGVVKDCLLSGFLVASRTASGAAFKISGTDPEGSLTLDGTDASDVVRSYQ